MIYAGFIESNYMICTRLILSYNKSFTILVSENLLQKSYAYSCFSTWISEYTYLAGFIGKSAGFIGKNL